MPYDIPQPMLAKAVKGIPDPAKHGGLSFEPKWDGFRCIVFRDGDDLDLQSRNQKPLLRYFPELREPLLAQLPEQVVLDGELYRVGDAFASPDTPDTRARIRTLYGSTQRAAVPAAVVRARTVADANADYRNYVRSERCENGRFRFDGLPDGGWFLIVPVTSGDAPLVLMQSVQTRGGRAVSVTV